MALVRVINDLKTSANDNEAAVLVTLDLSATFDTVDQNILIEWLENWLGICGTALDWFRSYIPNRQFFVAICDLVSQNYDLPFGVAQGSCLGPLLFILYMLSLSKIIWCNNLRFHSYTADMQLYISLKPEDDDALNSLFSGLSAMNKWMSENFLKLNEDKTEILLVGPQAKRDRLPSKLGKLKSQIKPEVTCLGVVVDSDLNLKSHIKKVTRLAWSSQTRMNWWSPLDERRNLSTDMLLSPAAFDLIAQITTTWTNENIHISILETLQEYGRSYSYMMLKNLYMLSFQADWTIVMHFLTVVLNC